jgi:hypothetical protein
VPVKSFGGELTALVGFEDLRPAVASACSSALDKSALRVSEPPGSTARLTKSMTTTS